MFYPCRIVLPSILNSREDFPVNASHPLRFPSNILPKFISRKRETKEQTNSCPSCLLPAVFAKHFFCIQDFCHMQQLAALCPRCPLSTVGAVPVVRSSGSGNQAGETPLKTRVIVIFIIPTRWLSGHGGAAINKLPGITGRAGTIAGHTRTCDKSIMQGQPSSNSLGPIT